MTDGVHQPAPADEQAPPSGALVECFRCRMEVRRLELDVHLAHAHNIGPDGGAKKEKRKDGGRNSRSRY